MRVLAMFAVLAVAAPCHAEDPLETLNTVKDTIATMEQTLKQRGSQGHALTAAASQRMPVEGDQLYLTRGDSADRERLDGQPRQGAGDTGEERETEPPRPE